MSLSTTSVTKTIIGYLTKKDSDQIKNPTQQLQKIKFGKNCKNDRMWTFDENIDETRFNSLKTQFDNLYTSCDDVVKPLSSNNLNVLEIANTPHPPQIVKTKKRQRVYTHNEYKHISIEGRGIPNQYKLGKIDILVDFSCNHKHQHHDIDIRFVSQQINTTSIGVDSTRDFDSVWEQHHTTFTFFDYVCVDFIIEFDVTNPHSINSSINRIEITVKKDTTDTKDAKTQIDIKDFELLLNRIFDLISMSTHKSSKSSKSCNRKKCKKCKKCKKSVFEIICNYQKL